MAAYAAGDSVAYVLCFCFCLLLIFAPNAAVFDSCATFTLGKTDCICCCG